MSLKKVFKAIKLIKLFIIKFFVFEEFEKESNTTKNIKFRRRK